MLYMNEHFKKINYKYPMPETNSALEFILWRFKELGITMEELATIVVRTTPNNGLYRPRNIRS